MWRIWLHTSFATCGKKRNKRIQNTYTQKIIHSTYSKKGWRSRFKGNTKNTKILECIENAIYYFSIFLSLMFLLFSICACNLGISYPRYFPENMRARMYPMNTVVSIALYLVLVVVMDPLHDSKLNQFLMGHTV